jgi:2-polyprenyl-6-methoxyphenol hydroxylase-like FAD-dependent oxidoreductase
VVIGASLSGLFAAAVLSSHVEEVVVVERDRLPDSPRFRAGVPQSRHAHAFMEGGLRAMNTVLPGIVGELTAAGAVRTALPSQLLWLDATGWADRRLSSQGTFFTCTRALLNYTVQQRVARYARVRFVEATAVHGLLHSGGAVRGVRLQAKGGEPYELSADIVVDASGRSSSAPKWLAELGYPQPAEEVVDPGIAYATRVFRRTPRGNAQDFSVVSVQPTPEQPTMGLLIPVEDDGWMLALGGLRGHEPPTDEAGWLEFARNLRSPIIHELISEAEPRGPIFGYRNTQNRRRAYDKSERHPEGFLLLGDAVCTFNPIYGQGMSVAALEALALRDLLAQHGTGPGLARRVQKMVARVTSQPWTMATTEDRRYPSTIGGRALNAAERAVGWYLSRVATEALVNGPVGEAFFGAVTLTVPASKLVHPKVIWAALRRPSRHVVVPEPTLAPAPAPAPVPEPEKEPEPAGVH